MFAEVEGIVEVDIFELEEWLPFLADDVTRLPSQGPVVGVGSSNAYSVALGVTAEISAVEPQAFPISVLGVDDVSEGVCVSGLGVVRAGAYYQQLRFLAVRSEFVVFAPLAK